MFLVTRRPGPAWDHGRPRRSQEGWDAHAAFMDGLVASGFVVLGGPLDAEGETGDVLLVIDAPDEAAVRTALAADPWPVALLDTVEVRPWRVWLDGRAAVAPDERKGRNRPGARASQ